MVTTIDIIQLIFQILIAIALLYMAFFKSYFQEKGKNLATKEDIEEITKKVESIKTGLQFSLEAKLSWRAEEHDALVDYYSKYGALLSGITNISFEGISQDLRVKS
jgi:flagellar basal body-associated protein FliL